jgi:hypothetical protein
MGTIRTSPGSSGKIGLPGLAEIPFSETAGNAGLRRPALKVTFDTNTLSGVVDPDQELGSAYHPVYQAVHDAVNAGRIRGFFSEAVVTLDAIGHKSKAEILGAARFVSETVSTGPNHITITLGPRWPRVDIDHRILARIESARVMGMRALIGPRRFGDSLAVRGFGEDFYEPYPSSAAFLVAVDTANALDKAIVAKGLGRAQVIKLAKFFSQRDGAAGEWWPQGLERTRSAAERKKVRDVVNEWADGEALAAHAGYGNDLFCTHDRGGGLGDRSVLHPSHRAWLSETHDVTFVDVAELAERLATAP